MHSTRAFWICLSLAGLTLVGFYAVCGNEFVTIDDFTYVVENPWVLGGVSGSSVDWALSTLIMGFWHPLTMLSFLLDTSIYGPKAAWGFHLTNLLLHLANVLLVFRVLTRLTGAQG